MVRLVLLQSLNCFPLMKDIKLVTKLCYFCYLMVLPRDPFALAILNCEALKTVSQTTFPPCLKSSHGFHYVEKEIQSSYNGPQPLHELAPACLSAGLGLIPFLPVCGRSTTCPGPLCMPLLLLQRPPPRQPRESPSVSSSLLREVFWDCTSYLK